ncbi:MAG: Na(+)/H(+) antiporter subunit D [Desulfurivibrionaceae bacterium]
MNNIIPPAAIFILGGLVIPLLRGRLKTTWMLFLTVAGFINLLQMDPGIHWSINFLDLELIPFRADRLSMIFGYIFHIISFIAIIYIMHVKNNVEYVAGFLYAGAALGVIFAGDLFTFFAFWEMLTVTSVMLIWQRKTREALAAGFRYFMMHALGGLVLFAGIILYVSEQGSLEFGYIGLEGLGSHLIFIGIGLNCAWPVLHSWLTDAYPEATIGGTVFLSAFTTKTAVYALARAYPGAEILIWIGVAMAAFPIFYAVIENDLRRVLAYSLINQVGFMVVGIGIGTHLAINGAIAHAFNDIVFKALLFMSVGAVMYRTGTAKATSLGGLYKSMPLTAFFCIVGAASISAFPLFSGFVSKSMVMEAAAHGHMSLVWLVLLFASAGVFHHAGIKIPYFAFYSHDAGYRVKEAPTNMLIAMGIAAFLCIFNGSSPGLLYSLLPYQDVVYEPYSISHVISQSQLLFFSALAFALLLLAGIYPAEIRAVNLDTDWLYRKGGKAFYALADRVSNGVNAVCGRVFLDRIPSLLTGFARNGPAHLSWLILSPLWIFLQAEKRKALRTTLYHSLQNEFLTFGLMFGIVSTYFFIVLSMV